MAYNMGIDVGIASVGFAAVDTENNRILACGVHLFEAAEDPKTGASLAQPRRQKRAMRRVIHRRAQRKKQIQNILINHHILTAESLARLLNKQVTTSPTPWELRRDALSRLLSDEELATALYHINKRRGFRSTKKGLTNNDNKAKDDQAALKGADEFQTRMQAVGAVSVGAFLASQAKQRNSDGAYDNFVKREWLQDEVRAIFKAQRKLGNPKATDTLEQEFLETFYYQRPLQSSENMIGTCSLTGEPRAPRFSYTAELSNAWQRINHCKIRQMGGAERTLTPDEKRILIDLAHKNAKVTYKQARKELALGEEDRFNISYRKIKEGDSSWEKIRDTSEASTFLEMKGYHTLKKILAADWDTWRSRRRDELDQIAHILSVEQDENESRKRLTAFTLTDDEIKALCGVTSFNKVVDLSLTALRKIEPYLQQGMVYSAAVAAAGMHHSQKAKGTGSLVPVFEDTRNPVVNRALSQVRKVMNAILRRHGMPDSIMIELAREFGKSFEDRRKIEQEQKKNQANREGARHHAAELMNMLPDNVRGEEILKYRLIQEQNHMCGYCGSALTEAQIKSGNALQIDHILPYSRTFDDSYMNKLVCHVECNQEKGNRTPFEWLSGKAQRWEGVKVFAQRLPFKKRANLLAETIDEDEWKSRALNDTRYMARLLKTHLEASLATKIEARDGGLTARLRSAWAFLPKDRSNDRHHALDAIVLACSTQSMVQKFASWDKFEARQKHPDKRPHPPAPWETFRHDVMDAVFGTKNEQGQRQGGIFVSRMPVRKVTGAAHEETVRSIRKAEDGSRQIVQRYKLAAVKPAILENMVDKERNQRLYDVLKARLDAHNGDPAKAFATPIHMPTNNPNTPPPQIKGIRAYTNDKSGIEINEGLVSNGSMIRVDVFGAANKKGKMGYYLVPIYAYQFAEKALPNKAIVGATPEAEWPEMDDKDFLFSLYKNDYVFIEKSNGEYVEGYFAGADRATASITLRWHDGDPSIGKDGLIRGIGVKTLLSIEKYSISYFGERTRIGKEKRLGVACSDDPESSEGESA